jgi:5-methylcytosine-specific restriction endonuclease McrA
LTSQKISEAVRQQVSERAKKLCEYCHTAEQWQYVRFTVDHIVPVAQGGGNDLANLAFACFHCNRQKGAQTTAVDPESGAEVSLFNPRKNF